MYLFIHRKDLRSNHMRAFDYIKKYKAAGIHLLIIDPKLAGGSRLHTHSGRNFVRQAAALLHDYATFGKELHVLYGDPAEITEALLQCHPIDEVIVQADYTPYARLRDEQLQRTVRALGRRWTPIADAPIADLEAFQAFTRRTEPYKVFTPFYRMWSTYLQQYYSPSGDTTVADLTTMKELSCDISARYKLPEEAAAALGGSSVMDCTAVKAASKLERFVRERMASYSDQRDLYAENLASGLSRFINSGAISARQAYETAHGLPGSDSWIRQLAWRDFYIYQAMFNEAFFRYEETMDLTPLTDEHFEAWSRGATGIPIIDAAMTQLNRTGEMPNRLRMVTAMFLTKNLLCPFTLGEDYFRLHLSDYDNILNRGGWLWSSSLGYDAAPYFRVMNPVTQSQTHDPSGSYIRRLLPHLAHLPDKAIHLPQPGAIVDLKASRARAIEVYKGILS